MRILITLTLTVAAALVSACLLDAPPSDDSDFLPPEFPAPPATIMADDILMRIPTHFGASSGSEYARLSRMIAHAEFELQIPRTERSAEWWDPEIAIPALERNREHLEALREAIRTPELWRAPVNEISNRRYRPWPDSHAIELQRLEFHHHRFVSDEIAALQSLQDLIQHIIHIERSGCTLYSFRESVCTHITLLDQTTEYVSEVTNKSSVQNILAFLEANSPSPSNLDSSLRIEFARLNRHYSDNPNAASLDPSLEWALQIGGLEDRSKLETRLFHKPNLALKNQLDLFRATSANAAARSYPERPENIVEITKSQSRTHPWVQFVTGHRPKSKKDAAAILHVIESEFWMLRTRHALAVVASALHLHQLEHNALPGSLSELSPGFLTEIPADPYTGTPLLFDPERRTIGSQGLNDVEFKLLFLDDLTIFIQPPARLVTPVESR